MKNIRRSWTRPRSHWSVELIEREAKITKQYGLRRKREIRVAEQFLRAFRGRARSLIALKDEREEGIIVNKAVKLGLLPAGEASLDSILALTVTDLLERRLQTLVFKRGMAKSIKHARQLIVHGFVSVKGRRMPFPAYTVPAEAEDSISWYKQAPEGLDKVPAKAEKARLPGKQDSSSQAEEDVPKTGEESAATEAAESQAAVKLEDAEVTENQDAEAAPEAEVEGGS